MSTWAAPVRYSECDQQAVAFNGHYLTWADETMEALMASLGTPFRDLAARGLDVTVVATELSWSSSARWGDVVEVDAAVDRVGRTSFVVDFTIRVGERECCRVRTTYVLHGADRTPTPVPDDLRAAWLSGAAAP